MNSWMLRVVYAFGYYAALVYWFLMRPQVRGVKVVLVAGGEVLLIRNSYGPRGWTFPGGGIHAGEAAKDAAIREVREEVGIQIGEPEYVGMFLSTKEFKADHVEVFTVYIDKHSPVVDNTEVVEARWFSLDTVPSLNSSGQYTYKIAIHNMMESKQKSLRFKPELVNLILAGKKTTTWRLFDDKDLQEGDVVNIANSDTNEVVAQAKLGRVYVKPLGEVTDEDYEGHERYPSFNAMIQTFRGYYGDRVDGNAELKVIHFTLL